MSFAETQRQVQAAAAALARVAADATGWGGAQREQFNQARLKPLTEAATKLAAALGTAQEAQAKAERLLAE